VFLAFMVAMPFVLGAVIQVYRQVRDWPAIQRRSRVVAADPGHLRCFAGAANAVRELVKERRSTAGNELPGCPPVLPDFKLVILGLISDCRQVMVACEPPLTETGSSIC